MAESIPFSTLRELSRTLSYTIPSLALIWYLILIKKSLPGTGRISLKPRIRDLYPFIMGFPALVLVALAISLLTSLLSPASPPTVEPPGSLPGWIVMILSCAGTGYLEESFFRFYLLKKMAFLFNSSPAGHSLSGNARTSAAWRIAFSVFLFAFCHLYEGLWGVLNAALAGIILAVLFERYKSLHGVAWAHGAYNAFVYTMGIFLS